MRADPRFKPLPLEAATLLTEGKLIDAIKSLRASHGIGLKEAKDWIDAHLESEPMLRVQLETQQREQRRRFFGWFLLVDVIITAALIYYFLYVRR